MYDPDRQEETMGYNRCNLVKNAPYVPDRDPIPHRERRGHRDGA